jgi:hypothetical protein
MFDFKLRSADPKMRHSIPFLAALVLLSQGGEAQKRQPPENYTLVWSD